MDKLQELLKALEEAADDEAISGVLSALEQDELGDAKTEIAQRLIAIRDGKADLGEDDPVEVAKALRAAHDAIDAEITHRADAAQAAQEELDKALEGLDDTEPEEVEPVEATEEEEETEEEKVPVTAAVHKAAAYLGRVIDQERADAAAPNLDIVLTASGPVNRHGTLSDAATVRDLGALFNEGWQKTRDKSALVIAERHYPESRQLASDPVENTIRLNDVTATAAIVAAGGICDPAQVDFSHPVCGMEGRPIRDGLPSFQLTRGRLRYGPAVSYGDLAAAITVWDVDTDENPGTAVKACPRITCEAELSTEVQAVVKCITIGNFQARYNPEFFAANLSALNVAFDAAAEAQLYDQIVNGSTSATVVNTGQGTIPNLLVNVDKLAAGIRSVNRLPREVTLDLILPDWIESALRSQLAVQPARYAGLLDPTPMAWFSARNIRPIFSPDAAPLTDPDDVTSFPSTLEFVLFPNGTWVYGDGGTLDLGVIRDSTLNATNDLQIFSEGFEVAFMRGCTSYVGEVALDDTCIDCLAS